MFWFVRFGLELLWFIFNINLWVQQTEAEDREGILFIVIKYRHVEGTGSD